MCAHKEGLRDNPNHPITAIITVCPTKLLTSIKESKSAFESRSEIGLLIWWLNNDLLDQKKCFHLSSYRKRDTRSSRPLPSINKFFLFRVLGHGLIIGIYCEWAILVWKKKVARIVQYSEAWYLGYRVVEKCKFQCISDFMAVWGQSPFLVSVFLDRYSQCQRSLGSEKKEAWRKSASWR